MFCVYRVELGVDGIYFIISNNEKVKRR